MNKSCRSIFILVFFLTSCYSANYHAYDRFASGYTSIQTGDNAFRVTYTASHNASFKKLDDWVLLRSAELTLENDYTYFSIQEAKDNRHQMIPVLDIMRGNNNVKARSQLFIRCYSERQNDKDYDAREIVQEIKDKYLIVQNL